jgi:hypothetical protein
VIGIGELIAGTGIILSPGFCTVTCENDIMSVVMGGNVTVWSLIVTGTGVTVVDSVSLIGGSSMLQGGLHVTTGDDVSHISGNAIVERLPLVVGLVLKVESGTSSAEEEVKDVVKTDDESAVDGVELVPLLVCIAAVPVLVFELIRELSTTELVRMGPLDASENGTGMAVVVIFPITVALAISVDVVIIGIEVDSVPEVKPPDVEVLVMFNEKAGVVVKVFKAVTLSPSDSEVEVIWTPKLVLAAEKALVLLGNGVLDTRKAVAFCVMPVFIGSRVEVEIVESPGDIQDALESGFIPTDVELFEVVGALLILDGGIGAIDEAVAELEIVLLVSCGTDVIGKPELEAIVRVSDLLCPVGPELSSIVDTEAITVDAASVLRLVDRRLVGTV